MIIHTAGRTSDGLGSGETALPQKHQSKIDRAAALARDAAIAGKEAAWLAVHENSVEGREKATRLASQAGGMAWDAAELLVEAGAQLPGWQPRKQHDERDERAALDTAMRHGADTADAIDTCDARQLVALLMQAQDVAERIEASRWCIGQPRADDAPAAFCAVDVSFDEEGGEEKEMKNSRINVSESVSALVRRVQGEAHVLGEEKN